MQIATFKEWTLTKLENTFGIQQIYDRNYYLLKKRQDLSKTMEITDLER